MQLNFSQIKIMRAVSTFLNYNEIFYEKHNKHAMMCVIIYLKHQTKLDL